MQTFTPIQEQDIDSLLSQARCMSARWDGNENTTGLILTLIRSAYIAGQMDSHA